MNFFLRIHIISPLIHNDKYLSIISQSNFSPKPIENFSESKHSSNIRPNITHLKTQSSNKFTVNISGFIKVKTQNWDPKTFHNNHHSTITITIPVHKQQQHNPHPKQSVQNENGLYSNLNLNPTSENKSQTRKKKTKRKINIKHLENIKKKKHQAFRKKKTGSVAGDRELKRRNWSEASPLRRMKRRRQSRVEASWSELKCRDWN